MRYIVLNNNISFYYPCLYPVFLNSEGQGLKEIEPDPETRNVLHCVSNSQQVVYALLVVQEIIVGDT